MITLAPNAVTAARTIVKKASAPTKGPRVQVEAGGCPGSACKMDLENEARDDDNVVEADGVKIFIDDLSLGFFEDMSVDFVPCLERSGFVFENPNATTQCGCGKSFA